MLSKSKYSFISVLAVLMIGLFKINSSIAAEDINASCDDANVLSNVFDQVCWDCFLDGVSLFGAEAGTIPDGAHTGGPICSCVDPVGVIEFGYPLGYWAPSKLNEVVTNPWCSPALGGVKLQDSLEGMGHNSMSDANSGAVKSAAFYHYHYFTYPLMAMLSMLVLPSCADGYMDMDLQYISEIDPLWNNDLLALVLNPEAIIYANPAALAWCAIDCALTTQDDQGEEFYGCAGCDGSLYPITGNVYPQPDPVAGSSLITQRVLASLHRKGVAKKTMGDGAMCEPSYFPTIPRSQYKFSMLYPVPEANSDTVRLTGQEDSTSAGSSGLIDAYSECCHPMGMSTSRWCTPAGGRNRAGKDNAYIYMIWNYRDCCVRNTSSGGSGESGGESGDE